MFASAWLLRRTGPQRSQQSAERGPPCDIHRNPAPADRAADLTIAAPIVASFHMQSA
jgi:hypothetical protein